MAGFMREAYISRVILLCLNGFTVVTSKKTGCRFKMPNLSYHDMTRDRGEVLLGYIWASEQQVKYDRLGLGLG